MTASTTPRTHPELIAALRADLGEAPFAVDAELQDQMADAVEHDHVALHVPAVEPPRFRGNTDQAVGQLRTWHDDGWRVLVATDGPGLAERVREDLGLSFTRSRRIWRNLPPAQVYAFRQVDAG